MTGDEKKLLELFRACDNRGKSFLLVIAEAEAKHGREGPHLPRCAILTDETHNLPMKEAKS